METQDQKPVHQVLTPGGAPDILLSVVIVSYNVAGFLDHCLDSVFRACLVFPHEVMVVDNSSTDNTVEMVRGKYPQVRLIDNPQNIGYSRANNQGIALSRGQYVLLLNPDTIVPHNALSISIKFLEGMPDAGLMSLKLVNADGSFQAACRRGFPTPLTSFYRMVGLSLLFRQSRRFGQYNLTFLDENATSEVDAVCGAFMLGRASVLRQIGGFDENFFMFGEDIDLCYRVKRAGYRVFYHPAAEIIHFKGESSRKNRVESKLHFYNSMFIFSKKYFSQRMTFFPRGLLFLGIFLNALVKLPAEWLNRYLASFIDLVLINGALYCGLIAKFGLEWNFYSFTAPPLFLLIHFSLSLTFILTFAVSGLYSGKPRSLTDYFRAAFIASLLFFSFVYFIPNVRFSRIAFTLTCATLFIVLPGWRLLFSRTAFRLNTALAHRKRFLIVGHGSLALRIRDKLMQDPLYRASFAGFIAEPGAPQSALGKEIAGDFADLKGLVRKKKINEVFLAVQDKGSLDLVSLINFCAKSAINLKMVESIPGQEKIYVLDVEVSENIIL
jgi:GT2 family glycosyltransferase